MNVPIRCFLLLSIGLLLGSCKKENPNEDAPTRVERRQNISYGTDNRHKLDVFLPAYRNSSTPFILFLHGGSWVSGDKADMRGIQEDLLQKGIASASMNYRYASQNLHFPELMQDVHQAVSFCKTEAPAWKIRSDKFLIGGVSAGAHLSLLYGYAYDSHGIISGIVSAAGPTNLTDIDWLNWAILIQQIDNIHKMVGAVYTPGQALDVKFTEASPLHRLRNVPTLMIHGTGDLVVPYSQSEALDTALTGAGTAHKLVTIDGANHDLGISNQANLQLILREIENWVNAYGR